MSSQKAVQVIFGAANIKDLADLAKVYDTLSSHNVQTIDTAHIYPDSEVTIGSSGGSERFAIDTKAPGFRPSSLTADSIKAAMKQTLEQLKVKEVQTYFLHAPDPETSLEETLGAINDLYVEGKFKRFGISNYSPEDVTKIHELATKHKWVAPSVYQGNYNPAARHTESDLFPVLRKYNMAFNAYSPLAGGFLVKSKEQLAGTSDGGRWDQSGFAGQLYFGMYGKPSLLEALSQWEKIAKDAGISKAALCYRWVAYHSALKGEYGDAMIIGASRVSQLEETLKAYEQGPLPESAAKAVDEFWQLVKDDAPVDNYQHLSSSQLKF